MFTEGWTLIVPEAFNDGTPVPLEQLAAYETELVEIFDGYTLTSAIGAWRSPAGVTFREPIRKYELDTSDTAVHQKLLTLASRIALELAQDATYLRVAPVTRHLISGAAPAKKQTALRGRPLAGPRLHNEEGRIA